MLEDVCKRVDVEPTEPEPGSNVGIAFQTIGAMPIDGLRHPVEVGTNGPLLWCGEYSEGDDFFQPLHVEHLEEFVPQVMKYLCLPPGYRFVTDDSGYEDIWFDEVFSEI